MTIGYNKYQFYGKLMVLLLVLVILIIGLSGPNNVKFDHTPVFILILFIFSASLLCLMLALMALQLFLIPIGIEIDHEDNTVTMEYFLSKSIVFQPSEVSEYSSISIATRSSSFAGIMIRNINGKEYIISDSSLENYLPVKEFLDDSKVAFAGHKKFSFFAYFFRYFTT